MIVHNTCPNCHSKNISPALAAKDYTVSGESFDIWECAACTLRFTQAVPDKEEIGRYYQSENYISHSDTDKGLINQLYHRVRKHTLQQKKELVQKNTRLRSGSILDVGCGTGAFLHTMKAAGWACTGIEPDQTAREKAFELYGLAPQAPEMLFSLAPGGFDAITLWHVLEHVHDLHGYMEQLKILLAAEGRLFIAVPNYTAADAHLYGAYWAAYDVPRHLYHFSPQAMKQLLSQHDFALESIRPMWYDSIYVSMLSEQYKTGKFHPVKAFINGSLSNFRALADKSRCSSVIYIIRK